METKHPKISVIPLGSDKVSIVINGHENVIPIALIGKIGLIPDMEKVLKHALQIVGKVVADNLMPDIVAPKFPEATMKNIEMILAKLNYKTNRA